MNVLKKVINTTHNRNVTYHLFFLGDIHNGNICFDKKALLKDIDRIKNIHNAVIFGMGDYNDYINYLDPRFNPSTVNLNKDELSNCAYIQTKQVLHMLKPVQDKFVGFLSGNHEEKIAKKYNFDVMQMIHDETGKPIIRDSALIRLCFKRGKAQINYDIFIAHSRTAGRKKGNKLNLLDDLTSSIQADVYIIGHNHNLIATKKTKLFVDNRMNIKAHEIILGTSGSYLKSYEKNASSYIEKTLYPASTIGCLEIIIKPRKGIMQALC